MKVLITFDFDVNVNDSEKYSIPQICEATEKLGFIINPDAEWTYDAEYEVIEGRIIADVDVYYDLNPMQALLSEDTMFPPYITRQRVFVSVDILEGNDYDMEYEISGKIDLTAMLG